MLRRMESADVKRLKALVLGNLGDEKSRILLG